jgi:2'-5' RNA ligase
MPPRLHSPEYSYWLMPCEPLKSELRAIIDRLAAEWKAEAFDPHVTIYGGPSSDAETHLIGRQIAEKYGPIELAVQGLRHSDMFTKTFFIQFAESDVLRRMSTDIKNAAAEKADYELNPHLSLLYQNITEAGLRALCNEVAVPKGIYRFNALRVIHTETPVEDTRAIKEWRSVFDAGLKEE